MCVRGRESGHRQKMEKVMYHKHTARKEGGERIRKGRREEKLKQRRNGGEMMEGERGGDWERWQGGQREGRGGKERENGDDAVEVG